MSDYENANKYFDCFVTMKRWLENRNNGKTFDEYFIKCGYKEIAIYGAGDVGNLIYEEVKNSDVKVKYFVDRNGEGLGTIDEIPVITLNDIEKIEEVDIMVVSPIDNYDAICRDLLKISPNIRTLSLKDAVYEF